MVFALHGLAVMLSKTVSFVFVITLFLTTTAHVAVAQPRPDVRPRKLLIYYAWPSVINGSTSVPQAAAHFAKYNYVVIGDGLQNPGGDHDNTQAIIQSSTTATTKFFGYIDAGVSTQNLTEQQIATAMDNWQAMGIDGIFLDDFGYDFGVTRERQNALVNLAHARFLPVIVNAWDPEDVFGVLPDAVFNPNGLASEILPTDFYLAESYQVQEGEYQNPNDWMNKASLLDSFRRNIGFGVMSTTTNNAVNAYSQTKFNYAWFSSMIFDHEATAWGEYSFSSDNARAPYRPRPVVTRLGNRFTNSPVQSGSIVSRNTILGRVWVDTVAHTGGYDLATLTLTAPNGGETWTRGSDRIINWTDNFSGPVQIQLFQNSVFVRNISINAPSTGIFTWRIPNVISPGSSFKIRIRSVDHPSVVDLSDGVFAIQ
jgi:hypothetical protein